MITQTAGYKEAMDDIKHGRVTEYASLKDFYKEMGLMGVSYSAQLVDDLGTKRQ